MSVQSAMLFMRAVREDEEIARLVTALGPDATLRELCATGSAAGFEFNEDAMRAAHARDWSMRAIRYGRKSSEPT